MQFERRFVDGIASGEITLSFRRWRRPQVVPGHQYRVYPIGMIEVTRLEKTSRNAIEDADARRAGFASRAALFAYMDAKSVGDDAVLYRIELVYRGKKDPRTALAARTVGGDEATALAARLDAMDRRSPRSAWTAQILSLIAKSPGVRAADLAKKLGWDTPTFKAHVRRLKALGLTESLEVGYRLSPRGTTFLRGRD